MRCATASISHDGQRGGFELASAYTTAALGTAVAAAAAAAAVVAVVCR